MLLAPSATLSVLADRNKFPPWGLYGGKPGAKGEYLIIKRDGSKVKLKSKCTVRISQGDTFFVRTPGGGGYGDPLQRKPELVLREVINEWVSLDSARNDHGVIIESKTLKIDWKATEKLREKMKNQ